MPDENLSQPSSLRPPETDGTDKAYTVAKAAIAAIPVVGGSASELMALVFAPPYQKRQQKWQEEVAGVLSFLRDKKGYQIEDLQNNDNFISVVANAYQIAMRNHEKVKLEALRNALINTVLDETLDDSLKSQFLSYIDTLTVWHILILKAFFAPTPKGGSRVMGSPAQVLEEAYPELRNRREFYDLFWGDLYARGLVSIQTLHTTMSSQGVYAKRTTHMGDLFIEFITSPKNEAP